MMSIADNVKTVFERVNNAAVRAGRDPADITVLAASKMNGAGRVREAFDAGIRDFGENRVQELREKYSLGAYDGANLHFIGHLQKNKVKDVTGICKLIHSVDSIPLAETISKKACALGIVQDVLIEINVGGEASKSGILQSEADELICAVSNFPGIRVSGLMAIPPADADMTETRNYFDLMYKLFVDIKSKKYDNVNMSFLSMGMSRDYEDAILAGANIVRIGTSIFGLRDYSRA